MEHLELNGKKVNIRKVIDLPNTDYYEPYEHA